MVACPTCGKELTYIPQYDRWYCYAEGKYAPKGFGTGSDAPAIQLGAPESHEGHHHCPSCGRELAFIKEYDRWYCYAEGKYAPRDIQPVTAAKPVETAVVQPTTEAGTPVAESGPGTEVPLAEPQPAEPVVIPEEPLAAEPQRVDATPAETPAQEASPEPAAAETPAEPAPVEEPASTSEPLAAEETPREPERPPERKKKPKGPKLTRAGVTRANKTRLVKWCSAYDLDPTGTRVQLRDRLLAFMDDYRMDAGDVAIVEAPLPEPAPVAEPAPEAAPAVSPVSEPSPQPQSQPEPTPEPEDARMAGLAEDFPEPEPAKEPVPEAVPAEVESTPPPSEPEHLPEPEPAPESEPTAEPAPEPEPEPGPTPAGSSMVEPPRGEPRSAEAPRVEPPPIPAPAPEPIKVEIEKALPCPNCGKDLTYIAQYDRLYCFSCGRYAPKTYGKEGVVEAPRPVEVPRPAPVAAPVVVPPPKVEVPKAAPKAEHPCPTCGRELRYVRDYDRWWCEAERKYAPKEYGKAPRYACPTCGQPLKWINEYQRWYCYVEGKYAPRTVPAPAAAMVARPVPVTPAVRAEPAVAPSAAATVVAEARVEHLHGRPGLGIGLAVTGFVCLLIQRLLILLVTAGLLDVTVLGAIPIWFFPVLEFVGVLLALTGVAVGLAAARSR